MTQFTPDQLEKAQAEINTAAASRHLGKILTPESKAVILGLIERELGQS